MRNLLRPGMFSLGVTGGIAGGKSHACTVLERLGAHVIDADKLAHQAYAPGKPLNRKIASEFGAGILLANGEVDRRRLGKLVFGQPEKLKLLQSLVWPCVAEDVDRELTRLELSGCRWAVLEAALLLQASWDKKVDETWCFFVSPDVALRRVMSRDKISDKEALERMRSQPEVDFYLKHSRVAVDTSGAKEQTAALIEQAVKDLRVRLKASHGFELPGPPC